MRVQPPAHFINVDHHADGGMDGRGRGVARSSPRRRRRVKRNTADCVPERRYDEEEENVQQAVARIQAITRSREARDQYLRLRMVTQSMQERRAAIARGEAVKEEEDEDGLDDVDVEKEEDEDE